MFNFNIWLVLGGIMFVSSCTVGPNYQRPETAAPATWQALDRADAPALTVPMVNDEQALESWWSWFNDPLLTTLITRAFAQNLDTRAAWARIELARAERHAFQAERGPKLGAGLNASRQQNPLPGLAEGLTFSLYEAGFDASWEFDLFGRQRRRVEAADAAITAAVEDQRWIMTVLCAEVTRAYWEMRGAEHQLALAEQAVDLGQDSARLATRLVTAGISARQTALTAEADVAALAAQTPAHRIALATARSQIELLLGLPPGELADLLTPRTSPLPHTTLRLVMSPAAVLRNRPDIQQAERQLGAATSLKAAAIADKYPRISLGMFFGLRNTAISLLLNAVSKSWNGGGSILTPLFDAGRLRAAVDASDARVDAALVNYEKTMLDALHETELALLRLLESEHLRDARTLAVADLREARKLIVHRHAQGIDSRFDVVTAGLALNRAEMAQRVAELAASTETIAVLKALGAGIPREMTPYTPPKKTSTASIKKM